MQDETTTISVHFIVAISVICLLVAALIISFVIHYKKKMEKLKANLNYATYQRDSRDGSDDHHFNNPIYTNATWIDDMTTDNSLNNILMINNESASNFGNEKSNLGKACVTAKVVDSECMNERDDIRYNNPIYSNTAWLDDISDNGLNNALVANNESTCNLDNEKSNLGRVYVTDKGVDNEGTSETGASSASGYSSLDSNKDLCYSNNIYNETENKPFELVKQSLCENEIDFIDKENENRKNECIAAISVKSNEIPQEHLPIEESQNIIKHVA